jgi:hypothetical protein
MRSLRLPPAFTPLTLGMGHIDETGSTNQLAKRSPRVDDVSTYSYDHLTRLLVHISPALLVSKSFKVRWLPSGPHLAGVACHATYDSPVAQTSLHFERLNAAFNFQFRLYS